MGHAHEAALGLRYPARKDIRNTPHREIDRAGQRRMWSATAVVVVFVGLVLLSAWLRLEQIRLGYEIEQLQQQRAAAESDRRHLQLELETLRAPQRIEALAMGPLKLVEPSGNDAFVIERVKAAPAPSGTVVARR